MYILHVKTMFFFLFVENLQPLFLNKLFVIFEIHKFGVHSSMTIFTIDK